MGKVAADNNHKWVYSDTQNGCESSYIGAWNASMDHVREVANNKCKKKKNTWFIFLVL